jgi:hypothetical protein
MRRTSNRRPGLPAFPAWALAFTFTACADATNVDRADPDGHFIRPVPAPDALGPGVEDAFVPRDAWAGRADAFVQAPDATVPGPDVRPLDAAAPPDAAAEPDAALPDALAIDGPPPDAAPPPDACVAGAEVCNGLDDDCDGQIDEGLPLQWLDLDGDGYGSPSGIPTCAPAADRVANDGDCDDTDAAVNPDAEDRPELTFADTNCDDVDGDRRALLFVDAAAPVDGPVPADGTPERPFPTLARALEAALADARITGVAIAGGRYEETVVPCSRASRFTGATTPSAVGLGACDRRRSCPGRSPIAAASWPCAPAAFVCRPPSRP